MPGICMSMMIRSGSARRQISIACRPLAAVARSSGERLPGPDASVNRLSSLSSTIRTRSRVIVSTRRPGRSVPRRPVGVVRSGQDGGRRCRRLRRARQRQREARARARRRW